MTTPHVDDGTLIRRIDDECDAEERAALEQHLTGCDECGARLAGLSARTAWLSTTLRLADYRARRRTRPALRAAALIVGVLATGLLVEPVRAWVVERGTDLWSAVRSAWGAHEPQSAASPVGGEGPAAEVSFVPTGNVFVIEVATRQRDGSLMLETGDGRAAAAAVIRGTGVETLLVLPSGLRIVGGSESRADYAVRVPAGIARILVLIGDEPVRQLVPGGGRRSWNIPVGPGGP